MSVLTKVQLIAKKVLAFPLNMVKGESTQTNRSNLADDLINSCVLIAERQYEGYKGTNWLTGSREPLVDGVEKQFVCNGLATARGSANVPDAPFWNTTTNRVENLKVTQQYMIHVSCRYNAGASTDIIELVARTAGTNELIDDFPIVVEKNVDRKASWGTYMLTVEALAVTEGVKLYLKSVGGAAVVYDPEIHFKCDHEGLIDLNA